MCGIAGFFGKGKPDTGRIERTLGLMSRRGPDHRGFQSLENGSWNATLLHSRLSIIDLEPRSNQPFRLGDCAAVFNGEIYNYVELRRELEREGDRFTTDSDTEVLLRAYLRYGQRCVERFEGMWSFAIHNGRTNELFFSRDRFGEKPLFYTETCEGLYFGSEPKFIFELMGRRLRANRRQIARYLVNGYKSLHKTSETFFEGLSELPAAHSMKVQAGEAPKAWRHWELSFRPEPMGYEEAVEGVSQRLLESMRLRLRADVPLAFCLSGGVDSSALVSVAVKKLGAQAQTFSIVDEDPRYDETANIRKTVEDLKCRNTTIRVSHEGFMDRMRELVRYHDAPVATISYYAHSFLSEAIAKAGFRIAVSGSGADELFSGYFDHFNLYFREIRQTSQLQPSIHAWQERIAPVVRNPFLKDPRLFIDRPDFREHIYLDREAFQSYLTEPLDEDFSESTYTDAPLRNRMMNELFHEVMPVILHEDDLNSMGCSIENRSPYLDRELAEFAYRIPTEHLIRDGRAKSVLRDAVRGTLNDDVRLDAHKRGFNASVLSLVDPRDARFRQELLKDGAIFEVVDRNRVARVLEEDLSQNSFSKFLFSFISAKLFMENHE